MEVNMENFSTLQLMVGAVGVMILVISAAFAGYWNFFGKKNRTVSKPMISR